MMTWIFVVVTIGLIDGEMLPTKRAEVYGPYPTAIRCEVERRDYQAAALAGLPIAVGPCVEKSPEALAVIQERGLFVVPGGGR